MDTKIELTDKVRERLGNRIRQGLIKDFNALYVREYMRTWEVERVARETEIDIMELDNTVKYILSMIEPVALEALDDGELEKALGEDVWYYLLSYIKRYLRQAVQATVRHNQDKYGKLFRVKE